MRMKSFVIDIRIKKRKGNIMIDNIWVQYTQKLKEIDKKEKIVDRVKKTYKEKPITFCIFVFSWYLSVVYIVCWILGKDNLGDSIFKMVWLGWVLCLIIDHVIYKENNLQTKLILERKKQKVLRQILKEMEITTIEQYEKLSDVLSKLIEKKGNVIEVLDDMGKFSSIIVIPWMLNNIDDMVKVGNVVIVLFVLWIMLKPFKDFLDNSVKYRELRDVVDYIVINFNNIIDIV